MNTRRPTISPLAFGFLVLLYTNVCIITEYIFSKTPEKNWRSVAFHFTDGTETHWAFKYDIFVTQYKNQLSYDELIKQSQYPEIEPFFIILQDLGYYIWGLKWDFVPDFPFEKNDINREIIKQYEQ